MLSFINMELVVQLHIFKNSSFVVVHIKNGKEISFEAPSLNRSDYKQPLFFFLRDFCVLLFEKH